VGFHPHEAARCESSALEEIEELSHHEKVVGIGEIGLDYHYDYSPRERQQEVFGLQIDIARRRNLPIVIHTREAEEDSLRIVEQKIGGPGGWRITAEAGGEGAAAPRGVFHCFPGDEAMALKVNAWGFYISIPGPVTFAAKPPKQNLMAEVAAKIPLDKMLLETDSPYLTPVPFRGKRNEPSRLPIIAQRVAELKGVSVEEVGRVTSESVRRLFGNRGSR
jgi:TatD DNase family protein